jgi:hypothetical protein
MSPARNHIRRVQGLAIKKILQILKILSLFNTFLIFSDPKIDGDILGEIKIS